MVRKHRYYGLLLVLIVSVVFFTSCANDETDTQTDQDNLTEQEFKSLLSIDDVQQEMASEVDLDTQFYDYKEMAEAEDPQQVVNMDSFYGLSFQTEDGMRSMTLTVIDFDSTSSAGQRLQQGTQEGAWDSMQQSIGDESYRAELNSDGIGSMVIFLKGDKFVQLHTAMPDGESPIVDLDALEELAGKVEEKL